MELWRHAGPLPAGGWPGRTLIRALVVAGLVILFVAVAAMVFTAALHSQLATTITVEEAP